MNESRTLTGAEILPQSSMASVLGYGQIRQTGSITQSEYQAIYGPLCFRLKAAFNYGFCYNDELWSSAMVPSAW